MARANTPAAAVPTLGATTDQASRGGFFTQSNVDVVGRLEDSVVVNDSQITISINGDEQSFTLNQAMAETLQFTVEGGGGGGVGPAGPPGPQGPQGVQVPQVVTVHKDQQDQQVRMGQMLHSLRTTHRHSCCLMVQR